MINIRQYGNNYYMDAKTGYIGLKAPTNFSIINNTEEVAKYFNKMELIFKVKNIDGACLYFDLSQVKKITIDAIMYMNAMVLLFMERSKDVDKEVGLFWPNDKKCKMFAKSCGIKDFMIKRKENEVVKSKNDNFNINGGEKTDIKKVKEIALYSCEKLNLERKDIYFISNTMVELMNNTEQHAYDKDDRKLWFIFIENTKNSLKYYFFDTGKGIYKTMRKSFGNDLKAILEEDQSYFIFEALKRTIPRSSTSQENRNTGLPEIYKYYSDLKLLSNLKIISGRGVCEFYDSNRKKPLLWNLETEFNGTLFYWEVKKGV